MMALKIERFVSNDCCDYVIFLFRQNEALIYNTHSPTKTDKSLEHMLGNLNLNSAVTPQMTNLGLSQDCKSIPNRTNTAC